MEIPSGRMSPEQFEQAITTHETEHYKKVGDDWKCKKCDAGILQTTGHVSIHSKMFSGCTGGGEVQPVPLPYCPNCEGVPKNTSTCVHV